MSKPAAEPLTRRQAAIIGAYTGITCGPFEDIQALGDELMGRPTWTTDYGNERFVEELKARATPLFLSICAPNPEPTDDQARHPRAARPGKEGPRRPDR